MKNREIDVSIIFVNYKTKELTINAIKSVMELTEGIDYEIFVVDNASNDGSIEAIEEEFPNINIIKSDINGGFGYANNLAIKQAKGKYILCLNSDTLLINNAIKIMFDFMEECKNLDVGACGGQLYNSDFNKVPSVGNYVDIYYCLGMLGLKKIKQYEKKHSPLVNPNLYDTTCSVTNIHGANLFIRKNVLDKIGLFDERFFMYQEDTDLCKRIINNGFKLFFIKESKIMHLDGGSYNEKIERLQQQQQSLFIYFNKHFPNQLLFVKHFFLFGYIKNLFFKKERKKYIQMIFFILTSIYKNSRNS